MGIGILRELFLGDDNVFFFFFLIVHMFFNIYIFKNFSKKFVCVFFFFSCDNILDSILYAILELTKMGIQSNKQIMYHRLIK